MAYEIPGFLFTLPSNADYSTGAGQFRFVTVNTSGKAVASGAAADAIGVRQNKPRTDEAMTIMASGISKVEAGAAVAVGDLVKSLANGQAGVANTTADFILGRCIADAATASGHIITVLLFSSHPKF